MNVDGVKEIFQEWDEMFLQIGQNKGRNYRLGLKNASPEDIGALLLLWGINRTQ